MIRIALLAAAAFTVATPALAQTQAGQDAPAAADQAPDKVRSVTVYGNEPCPKSSGNEVVVCQHLNADEQFRIPKQFRDKPAYKPSSNSWANKAAVAADVSREAAGLPDTCSPNGSGGQTGCTAEMLRAWQAERQANGQSPGIIPR